MHFRTVLTTLSFQQISVIAMYWQLSVWLREFNPSDVLHTINSLPHHKASDHDLITPCILKHLSCIAIFCITYIFNAIICTPYFIQHGKKSYIILFPKACKPNHDATSYRPFSLLPNMDKIFDFFFGTLVICVFF